MAEWTELEHVMYGRRNVWHYTIKTDLGTFHIVCHEEKGLEITDDLLIREHGEKAHKAFIRACRKVLKEME